MSQKRKPESQSGKQKKKQQTSRPPPTPAKESDSSDEEKLRQAALTSHKRKQESQSSKQTKTQQTSTSRPPPTPSGSESSDEEQLRRAALLSLASHQKQQQTGSSGAAPSGASTSAPHQSAQQKENEKRTNQLLTQFGQQYGYATTGSSPQNVSASHPVKTSDQSNIGIKAPVQQYMETAATTVKPHVTSPVIKACYIRRFVQQSGFYDFHCCLFLDSKRNESAQQNEYCVLRKDDSHPWFLIINSVLFIADRNNVGFIMKNLSKELGIHLFMDTKGFVKALSIFHKDIQTKELCSKEVFKPNCIYPYSVERRVSFGVMIVSKFKETGLRRWYYTARDNTRGIWDLSDTNTPYLSQCLQPNRFTTDDYWAILLDINTKLVMIDLTELGNVESRKNYTIFLGGTVIMIEGLLRFRFPDSGFRTFDLQALKNAKIVKNFKQPSKMVFFLKPLSSVNDSLMWALYIDHDVHERKVLIQRRTGIFYFPGRDSIRNVLYTEKWDKGLECVQWYQSRCDWSQTIKFVDHPKNPFPQPFPKHPKPTQIQFIALWSGLPTDQWDLTN